MEYKLGETVVSSLFVILVESDAIYTSQPRMRIRAHRKELGLKRENKLTRKRKMNA